MATTATTPLTTSGIRLRDLSLENLRAFIEPPQFPCLSLVMPTHRRPPANAVDRGTYSGLVDALYDQLTARGYRQDRHRLTAPLRALEYDPDFWQNTLDGLAVFARDGQADVFRVNATLPQRAVLADRFCTLPLIPLVSSVEQFDLLALTSRTARIFSGSVDSLEPVDLQHTLHGSPHSPSELRRIDIIDEETQEPHRVRSSSGVDHWRHGGFHTKREDIDADTERFFREVDREILEQISQQTHRPLFLVALGEHAAVFRHLSKNPFLQSSCAHDPARLGPVDLAHLVEPLVASARQHRIDGLLQSYAKALEHDQGSGDPAEIAKMAAAGRVAMLLIEEGRSETGVFHDQRGEIAWSPRTPPMTQQQAAPATDLFEAICQEVMLRGGDVITLPRVLMPNENGLAAICRY